MTNEDRIQDAFALGIITDLLEEAVIPYLLERQQPPYMAAVARARALLGMIVEGRVVVLDSPATSERCGQ